MIQKAFAGLFVTLFPFSASADDIGIIVAKPQVNLPTADTLTAMGAELGVEKISIAIGRNPQEYAETFEAFQVDGASGVLTIGADYLDPNFLAALTERNGLPAGVRLPLLDLPTNLISGDQTDLYVVLPSGKLLARALSSAWFIPLREETENLVEEGGSWIASSESATKELWNIGFFPIGEESSGDLFLYSGNTNDDDGCGCEDSELAPYMTCDPDGASWSSFADFLSDSEGNEDGCGGECENGHFVPYPEFQASSLYRELVSNGWSSATTLNDLSSSGELIYVFTCDPD